MASPRTVGAFLVAVAACAALLSTACAGGYYLRRDALYETTASGFVAGNGSISSTRWVGPYGPVSGVSVGPGSVTVYDGYAPYGYGSPGYAPSGYGPYGYAPSGYAPYGYGGAPYGGTYTSCSGAVACGSSSSVTVETWGYGVPAPGGAATVVVTPVP